MPDLVGHDGKRVGSDNKTDGMNRHIYRLVAAVLAAITIVSCNGARKSETSRLLKDVDSYIEARPDSALAVLEGIDKSELTNKELEAKYALLLSQALDKNYIDLQSDSIIAPAVRYYENHGTPDERLKMYYYRGRISMNANNYEEAMEYFSVAGKYTENAKDKIAAGLLHNAKMHIYQYLYDSDSVISEAKKSSDMFLAGGDTARYINAINGVLTGYIQMQDTANAQYYLNIYRDLIPYMNIEQLSRYHSASLFLNIDKGADSLMVIETIDEYLSAIEDSSLIQWLTVANAYNRLSHYDKAAEALDLYLRYDGEKNRAFYAISSRTYDGLGNFERAYDDLYQFQILDGNTDLEIFASDAKFVEERYANELELLAAKYSKERIMFICIIIILCAVIAISLIRKQLKLQTAEKKSLEAEKKRFEQLYKDATDERDSLATMLKEGHIAPETLSIIRRRLEVLNSVVVSHISDRESDIKKANQELESLVSDRRSFILHTRITIDERFPEFTKRLAHIGLNDDEINICSLYAIGMKGKDIKSYTGQSRLYIQSAEIRHKLGLHEGDTNLSIILRNMLKEEGC